jgi:3-dehydrotetronate 4-kinase
MRNERCRPPDVVAAFQARHGRETSGRAIEQAIARIAADLVDHGVRRLVVAGGETSGAVVVRLRIPAFIVGPEIVAGIPVLRTVGSKDMKSGNFGGADFFADALALIT